jgi:hypothetical protein
MGEESLRRVYEKAMVLRVDLHTRRCLHNCCSDYAHRAVIVRVKAAAPPGQGRSDPALRRVDRRHQGLGAVDPKVFAPYPRRTRRRDRLRRVRLQ